MLGRTKGQRRNKMTENEIDSTMGSKGMCMSKFPQWATGKPVKPQSTELQNIQTRLRRSTEQTKT